MGDRYTEVFVATILASSSLSAVGRMQTHENEFSSFLPVRTMFLRGFLPTLESADLMEKNN